MQKRSDQTRDTLGRAIGGASITVYVAGTTTKATLYSDNGVTQIPNPTSSSPLDGTYTYFVANGHYDEVIVAVGYTFAPGQTQNLQFFDPADCRATIAVNAGAFSIGVNRVVSFPRLNSFGNVYQAGVISFSWPTAFEVTSKFNDSFIITTAVPCPPGGGTVDVLVLST